MNDLSGIQGTPDFTITVSAAQTEGLYKLANGAAGFRGTITISDTNNFTAVLTVGNSVNLNGTAYSLNLTDDRLTLSVGDAAQVKTFQGTIPVSAANVLTGKILVSGGENIMYVSSGGTANSTTVNYGGSLYVSSGGTANLTTISSAGYLMVSSGGTANLTAVNSYGSMWVSSGGTADSITVNCGGNLWVLDGGMVNGIVENGGDVFIAEGANVTFTPHVFSELVLSGRATVHSGTTAVSTTVNGFMEVSSGGTAAGTVVMSRGGLRIASGGTATAIEASSMARLMIHLAPDTYIQGSYAGSAFEMNNGTVSGYAVQVGGSLYVLSGGTADSTTVTSGGSLYVCSGGKADSTRINAGGSLRVSSGGMADSTTVNGFMEVASGGTASGTVVTPYGRLYVSSGGTATAIVASSMAGLYINVMPDTYIQGTRAGSAFEMNNGTISGYTFQVNEGMDVWSGGTADNTTVSAYGLLRVLFGGEADGTIIKSKGSMYVSSGGTAGSTTVNAFGNLYVCSGGKITGSLQIENRASAVVNSGAEINFDLTARQTTDGALVNNLSGIQGAPDFTITVSAAQTEGLYKLAEGAAGFRGTITISDTNNISDVLTVGNSVNLNGMTYTLNRTDASLTLFVEHTDQVKTFQGPIQISAAKVLTGKILVSGGENIMYVSSGGTANSTAVSSGGSLYVSSGGTAILTTVNSHGRLLVSSGGTANSTTVDANGQLSISSGGIAYGISVNSASINIESTGRASDVVVNHGLVLVNGGIVLHAEINYGSMTVNNGGRAVDAFIGSQGIMAVTGARASDLSVARGGALYVSNGGAVSGTLAIEEGGLVNISSGIMVFGLENHTPDGTALVNGLSRIIGNPIYCLTISGSQADGMYVLANGAQDFSSVISVYDESRQSPGAELGTLSVENNTLWHDRKTYTLSLDDGVLGVTVETDPENIVRNLTVINSTYVVTSGISTVSATVSSGGNLEVSSGGVALDTVNGNGMTVYDGGLTSNTCVGGIMVVSSGGTAIDTRMAGEGSYASMFVYNGGSASGVTVSGGNLILSGGNADDIVLAPDRGGIMRVINRGSASGIAVWRGQVIVLGSGTVSDVSIAGSMGSMTVGPRGSADTVEIGSRGLLVVSSGGTATNLNLAPSTRLTVTAAPGTYIQGTSNGSDVEMSDGIISGFTVDYGNVLYVAGNGAAAGIIVNDSGFMHVSSGGTANGIAVSRNGTLHVSGGGKVTGSVEILSGAFVSAYEGSIIDFDISEFNGRSTARVNDLSLISGTPDYTVTVSATQAAGVYTLAGGAAGFAETLSVCTAEECFGILTVNGDALKYGKQTYKLAASDNTMILTVTKESETILVNGKVIRYDGNLDVHTGSDTQTAGAIDSNKWSLLGGGSFGGGTTGLLWQENSTGNVYMQNDAEDVSDLTAKSNLLGVVGEGYEIGGIGDFFGTGLDGALLLTPAFGDTSVSLNYGLAVWARESDGTTRNGWLGALVNTWDEVDGMNQLKGDFQSLSGEARNQVINANNYRYELLGTADFNGDGKTDVMLRNNMPTTVSGETITGSGDVFIFLTDSHDNVVAGNRPAEGICYAGCATDGWNVVGFGDFNGDGTDDALLSDGTNLAGWMIQSGQRIGDYWFGSLSGWNFAGVGDYDLDGTDDILVSQGNEFAVWTVKNGAISGSIAIA